jgi:DnaJ-class molecular chaperone
MNNEYYELLGISKSADENEIKKAYRKLAIIYHPDKSPADKKEEYTENFKKISEAYEVLSDPEKKKKYDMFGKDAANMEDGGMHGGADPFDIFKQFFGENMHESGGGGNGFHSFHMGGNMHGFMNGMHGGIPPEFMHPFGGMRGSSRMNRKCEDIQITIPISLESGYKGCKRKIEYSRTNNNVKEKMTIIVEVPKYSGNSFRNIHRGYGNKKKDHEDGDLIIFIEIEEHSVFKVKENHLIIEKEIELGNSLLGIHFGLILLDDSEINIKVKGPIHNDDHKIIPNYGLKDKYNGRGHLILILKVRNRELTTKQKEIILKNFKVDHFKKYDGPTIKAESIKNNQNTMGLDDDDDAIHEMGGNPNVECAQS